MLLNISRKLMVSWAFSVEFGAQWARFGPYALIQFTTWEQLRYMAGIKPI